MTHVSGHKTQKTFMDYIKLSSEEIVDEIASMSKKESEMWKIKTLTVCVFKNNFIILYMK